LSAGNDAATLTGDTTMTSQTIICNNANDIDAAINLSIAENRIVHIEIPDGNDADGARYRLSSTSDDACDENDGARSFWGDRTGDGDNWRVTVVA
jgi:hypothetical protein